LKMPQPPQNVLAPADVRSLASLADFEPPKGERQLLSPLRLFGLGRLINRFIAPFRSSAAYVCGTTRLSLRRLGEPPGTATIVIPARNERGNIEAAIQRIPHFARKLEIIFVEGHSSDGTWDEIERVARANPRVDIKALRQPGTGKADAVYAGFDAASGDVLMILDADLTMPPEQLQKFWDAIHSRKGEFINGSRLIYPMEHQAMRFLNLIANKIFSFLFTWLLGQRFTDTLCGTKVLRRSD
jgi:cellulose synthase/poly-beta-1,6-N-acetylglucosamine synthase-like glycosyltransferase